MYVNMSGIIGNQLCQSDSGYKCSADNITTYDKYKKAETRNPAFKYEREKLLLRNQQREGKVLLL